MTLEALLLLPLATLSLGLVVGYILGLRSYQQDRTAFWEALGKEFARDMRGFFENRKGRW